MQCALTMGSQLWSTWIRQLVWLLFLSAKVLAQFSLSGANNNKLLGFKNNPKVRAECSRDNMFVYVDTSEPFAGIVNARGHRDACFQLGDGKSRQTVLIVPLLNTPQDAIYCAQQRDIATGDYKVFVDVHAHKMLELENDKTFLISCSQNGLLGNGTVRLSLLQKGEEASNNRLTQGEQYLLRIVYSNSSLRNQQLDVTNCVAFGRANSTQQLSDGRGCPVENSPLGKFDANETSAVAVLNKMFKFQDSTQIHLQCDVGFCRTPCQKVSCPGDAGYNPSATDSVQKVPRSDINSQGLAGATFTVAEPGTTPDGAVAVNALANQCGYGEWVLALCITFGILFLIMLIVNIVMCSAVSCNFTRKDRTDEVHHDPSAWGEYDTVKNVWSNSIASAPGSIPGDRHSVHSIPAAGHLVGQSQYQPRGPSPYYQPPPPMARGTPAMMHDDAREDLRERSLHAPPHYGDHYAMVHRSAGGGPNGTSKY